MVQTRIVPQKPAMILEGNEKNLIVSDFHIGFESSLAANEVFVGKNTTVDETIQELSEIIDSENPMKPFSDQKLSTLLSQDDIKVARRTVAKYREMLGIESSSKRKKRA